MADCRTIIDGPRCGAWNMAIDEVLLDRAARDERPQIRLYAWDGATLSLGYFQSVAKRMSHRPSIECPLVRRPSGGGAIVHDQEITYSLAIPGAFRGNGAAVYRRVHKAFATMFGSLGIQAAIVESAEPDTEGPPFLCFQRRTAGDVLIEGQKVVGSAQRRGRGALLQHGSILLRRSRAAPELPGIQDLAPIDIGHQEWVGQVHRALLAAFDWSAADLSLTRDETDLAERLAATKYGSGTWNDQR